MSWWKRKAQAIPDAQATPDSANALVVRVEMPGVDPKKDVDIEVSGNVLHIRAERSVESTVEEEGVYRRELQYGSFDRTMPLPPGAAQEDVNAIYKDGVLEVRIPIDQRKTAARKIEVQAD